MKNRETAKPQGEKSGRAGTILEGGPGRADTRLSMLSATGRTKRALQKNYARKNLRRDIIKSENEKFLAKLDAMPDGLDRKSRP